MIPMHVYFAYLYYEAIYIIIYLTAEENLPLREIPERLMALLERTSMVFQLMILSHVKKEQVGYARNA